MDSKKKLQVCLIANGILLIFLTILIFIFQTKSTYFRFGVPDKTDTPLIIVSVKIDTYIKYYILLFIICIVRLSKVIIEQIGKPILKWNIYNPDKANITEFSKNELQMYGNLFYLVSNLRYVFTIMIAITQIDIAVFSVICGEIGSLFTIRMLLNEKTFLQYDEIKDKEMEQI